jgi:sec-independent protein translocase protein TatC
MARRIRPASFDERMTLVEHLDELRNRIIVTLLVFGIAFGLCFWQDNLMLEIANDPLPGDRIPTTFGVTEPFFTTVEVSAYGAMILALPIILWQIYAFVLPAFSPSEKRVVMPFLIAIPFLFIAGVLFAYFLVLPTAVKFLLNFNTNEFDIQVRARDYYSFFGLLLLSMGILFQIPIGVLTVSRLGLVTPDQLAGSRRYAILVIAIVSAAAPGGDPVSMIMIMIPLLILYEGSIRLARRYGQPPEERAPATAPAAQDAP